MRFTIALCTFAIMTTVATWSPATASAQVIELTPFVGGLFPIGDFVDEDEFLGKHQTAIQEDDQTSRARLQNDIMLSVGVAIPVWGRR